MRGASIHLPTFQSAKMIWGPDSHGRQRSQMLRPPTILESEQLRLRDKDHERNDSAVDLLGNGSPGPLRESFGEALHAACMTAIISGPRYGSTVGTSLVISTNSRVWATPEPISPTKTIHVARRIIPRTEIKIVHIQNNSKKNPDNFFSSWEYFRNFVLGPLSMTTQLWERCANSAKLLPLFLPCVLNDKSEQEIRARILSILRSGLLKPGSSVLFLTISSSTEN